MRIIVVASLTILLLSACGTNQTEQMSKSEPVMKHDESQTMMEKANSSETASTSENIQDLKVESEVNSDTAADTTSDNGMIKETGVQPENAEASSDKSMEAMDGDQKDIAKEKEVTEKTALDQKG